MSMKRLFILFCSLTCLMHFIACNSPSGQTDSNNSGTRTPVLVTGIELGALSETIDLNATSTFLNKSSIKSPVSGYVKRVYVNMGSIVTKGQILFEIQTKEGDALQGSMQDSSLNFSGIVKVKARNAGQISAFSIQEGDFIEEGGELAVISSLSSLVFILEVPVDLQNYIVAGNSCRILLPEQKSIEATIGTRLPSAESLSQTIKYILKPSAAMNLPENLVACVSIIKRVKENAATLPVNALLTDETQTEWWVMKLINDSIAVKIPVEKGIVTDTKVEIIKPVFKLDDRIIIKGNYGLSDTAKIQITNEK